jgi:hypothetical protein
MVLVVVEGGPACISIILRVLGRIRLLPLWRLACFDRRVLFTGVVVHGCSDMGPTIWLTRAMYPFASRCARMMA